MAQSVPPLAAWMACCGTILQKLIGYTVQITGDFFLTLTLEPSGNIGKARLMSDLALKSLREVLS